MATASRVRLTALVLAAVAVGNGCGNGTEALDSTAPTTVAPQSITAPAPSSATTGAAPTTAPVASSMSAPPPPTTVPEGQAVVDVVVADGSVVGGAERVQIELGDEVVIRVTADVSDEVHLHGYDVFADVTPGAPAQISVVADIPGVFEVELEGIGLVLARLEVS